MKKELVLLTATLLIFIALPSFGQQVTYTTQNAHSHNDYEQSAPFFEAWQARFGSIEADIFPVDSVLLVAHDKKELSPDRSFAKLYIQPLIAELKKNQDQKVSLLIDIKMDHQESLKLLALELAPLKRYLVRPAQPNKQIKIIISGERPDPQHYQVYADFFYFDDDLRKPHTDQEWKRVGLVSLYFGRYSNWKGNNPIEQKSIDTLRSVIDSVHKAGKNIRFWGAPDNPASWELQKRLQVDLIGTDKIAGLKQYIEGKQND